jgi:Domain of unknown function (DUF6265)
MKSVLLLALIVFPFNTKDAFNKLSGLIGLWKMETFRGTIYEEWKAAGKSKLAGTSYKLKGTDTIALENMELQLIDEAAYFIPTVSGQNNNLPVRFKMIGFANSTFTFENKEHDFPQRVIYRLINNDSIFARIEGSVGGKNKFSNFNYSRVK